MIEYRNPHYNEHGTIDVEINHPDFGWIPFTASPDDVEEHGKNIFNDLKDEAAPYVPSDPEPDPVVVPEYVTRRQAKQQLLIDELLSKVQPAIDSIEDSTHRGLIQIYWDDSAIFERDHPELNDLLEAMGLDQEAMDELFINASKR